MKIFDFLSQNPLTQKLSETTGIGAKAPRSQELTLPDIIAPAAIGVTPRDLNVSGKLVRSFFAVSFPRYLTEGWLEPILNLERVYDVSIVINPMNTAEVLKQFQKKVAEVQSQMAIRSDKGMVRSPELEAAHRNLEELRDRLQQAEERLFDVGLYISIYGDTDAEMVKTETEIKAILDAKMVVLKPALFQQEQAFRSIIPIGKDELEVWNKFNSEPLSSFFPFTSFDLTADTGILYGVNRHNSSLILFDRFSLPNYNSVTFATS
jgi:conjugal transfer ATP-binding protein TraC